jgi:sugar phosphate isomerase/epimerase
MSKNAITSRAGSWGVNLGFTSWISDDITLDDTLSILSQAGCETVEVSGEAEYLSRSEFVYSSLRRHRLGVSAVSTGVPFSRDRSLSLHAEDEEARLRSVEYVHKCVDFASQIGAGIVYVCSITKEARPHEESLERLRTSLKSCADYAEGHGLVVAVEPFPTGELTSAKEVGELIGTMNSKNVGLLLDTGHLAISREPLADTARKWNDILVHVHLNNNDGVGDLHWPPQRGSIRTEEFRGLLAVLKSTYQGHISVELRSPELTAGTISDSKKFVAGLALV